jgi:septal ring factor EnvC (AmiA/AmiB activator)
LLRENLKDAMLNAQIDRIVAQEVAKAKARALAETKRKVAAAAAARQRAAELAKKRAVAEAAAKENARHIAEAKAREIQLKAQAEAARKAAEQAERQQMAAEAKKKNAAEVAAKVAAEQEARAQQAARAAQSVREAAERKAAADAVRDNKAIAEAKENAREAENLSTVDRMMSNGFEENRGRLPMPITGDYRIVSHFGQHSVAGLNGVTLDNKGINILGHSGCQARAIYDGEVSAVFGYAGTWVVMVRHGSYISVYCNLRSVNVHRGQHVSTRQDLGTVGTDNILQFQLRKETAKLNPEVWLGR